MRTASLAFFLLPLAGPASAQTHTFCAADTNCTATDNNPHRTVETPRGVFQCKSLEGIACVDAANSQGWGGSDMGAWINSAYAAAASTGADILVTTAGCVSFATPILLDTPNKPAYLHGSPGQITCLNYTPKAGTAVTLDWGETSTTNAGYGHGIDGILFNGPGAGTRTTALALGTHNGGEGLEVTRFGFQNFGTIVTFAAGQNFFQLFMHGTMGPAASIFNLDTAIENLTFLHVKFQCSFARVVSNALQFTNDKGLASVHMNGNSFDNCGVVVNGQPIATAISMNGNHFEELANSTTPVIDVESGTVSVQQSKIAIDPTSGSHPTTAVLCNTTNCNLTLGGNYYLAGQKQSEAINVTNGGRLSDMGDAFIQGTYTTPVADDGNSGESVFLVSGATGGGGWRNRQPGSSDSASTNTNISTVTMLTAPAQTSVYRVSFFADQTEAGIDCTGTTTVVLNLLYTDPNASSQTVLGVTLNIAVSGNGAVGSFIYPSSGPVPIPVWTFAAKASTTVRWKTQSYAAGTGCTTNPSYQIHARIEGL